MLLLLAACAKPVEAPADLDGLAHFFFAGYESASDEEMRAAAQNLASLVATSGRGIVTDLSGDEQATVPTVPPGDPADATGMYITGPIACDFADLEVVNYALDQEGLYEAATGDEEYIRYSRRYTSDLDDYEARRTPFLTWVTEYTVQPVPIAPAYSAVIDGSIRHVPADDADGGPVVVSRSVLREPATFEDATEDYFAQDYQIDVILPDGDGSAHLYVAWRDLSNFGQTDETEGIQNILLDGYEDFDRDTEEVCAAGGF